MIDLALRATVLLGVAFLLAAALRRASAAARHLVWATALGGLVILPAVPRFMPTLSVSVPTWAARTDAALSSGHRHGRRSSTTVVGPARSADTADAALPIRVSTSMLLWGVWGLGALLVLARLVIGLLRVRAVVGRASVVSDPTWTGLVQLAGRRVGVRRPIELRRGARGVIPITAGVLRPVIIVPADADAWDEERRGLVLTHEIGHVRRLDVLTHMVGQVAVGLFWFHPLAWLAAARMRIERERACDDVVLSAGARPSRYAGDLLELAHTLGGGGVPAAAALAMAMARTSEIERRLVAILDRDVSRGPVGPRRIVSVLAIATVAVVGLGVVRPVEARSTRRESHHDIRRDSSSEGHGTRVTRDSLLGVIRAVAAMKTDTEKVTVLRAVERADRLSDPVIRGAFFSAAATVKCHDSRNAVLRAVRGEIRGRRSAGP